LGFRAARSSGSGRASARTGCSRFTDVRASGSGRTAARSGGPRRPDAGTGCPRGTNARTSGVMRTAARTGGSGRPDAGTGCPRGMNATESLIPAFTLATMVSIIKILVIMLTGLMFAPIGILPLKILPVMRILLIPGIPPWRIPVIGSYNIGGGISVIGCPSICIAEIVIQHSIQKPITVIKGPWRIGPNPRCRVRVLRLGCISIPLAIRALTIGG
jgi:hypothetical protein